MSLENIDPTLLYTIGYIALGLAAGFGLCALFADRVSTKPRKGQQHPLGWRNSVKS